MDKDRLLAILKARGDVLEVRELALVLEEAWRERDQLKSHDKARIDYVARLEDRAARAVADHNKLFEDWERCEREAAELQKAVRNEQQIRDQWEKTAYSFQARANRAEAEVRRLRAIVPPRLRWPDGPVPG